MRQALVARIPGLVVETNVRGLIGGQVEIDLWFPERRIGVEYNGIYWHSERGGKDRSYHLDKYQRARSSGIHLVQVWEDDWRDRRDIVLSLLVSKLGGDKVTAVGARKCFHDYIGYSEANEFLNENHLLGGQRGSQYLGLRSPEGDLVALMVTRKQGREWVISRYATSRRVPGGFSRLLSRLVEHVEQAGGGRVVTFSDNCLSEGDLYRLTGFTRDAELRPDYRYAVPVKGGHVRAHKFGYRKKRFESDPELFFDPNMTESELATANKLWRVWDAGKVRWTLEVA